MARDMQWLAWLCSRADVSDEKILISSTDQKQFDPRCARRLLNLIYYALKIQRYMSGSAGLARASSGQLLGQLHILEYIAVIPQTMSLRGNVGLPTC